MEKGCDCDDCDNITRCGVCGRFIMKKCLVKCKGCDNGTCKKCSVKVQYMCVVKGCNSGLLCAHKSGTYAYSTGYSTGLSTKHERIEEILCQNHGKRCQMCKKWQPRGNFSEKEYKKTSVFKVDRIEKDGKIYKSEPYYETIKTKLPEYVEYRNTKYKRTELCGSCSDIAQFGDDDEEW